MSDKQTVLLGYLYTRRNLVAMLISIELVLNAADLNFAVFNRILFPGQLEGFSFGKI